MTWFVNIYMGSSGNRVPHCIHYWSIILIHYPHTVNICISGRPTSHLQTHPNIIWLVNWVLYDHYIVPLYPHQIPITWLFCIGVNPTLHPKWTLAMSRMCDARQGYTQWSMQFSTRNIWRKKSLWSQLFGPRHNLMKKKGSAWAAKSWL